jgi:hypothetical protein
MNKLVQITFISVFALFATSVFAADQKSNTIHSIGVFSKVSEPSANGIGLVFTDSETSKKYYVITALVEKVRPHLGESVKVKASVKKVPSGKACIMVWITSIKKQ